MKFYTKVLSSGSLVIAKADNVLMLSIKTSTSSSCTFTGNGYLGTNASETQTLGASDGLTLQSTNPQSPIEGITITAVSGTTNIIIGLT